MKLNTNLLDVTIHFTDNEHYYSYSISEIYDPAKKIILNGSLILILLYVMLLAKMILYQLLSMTIFTVTIFLTLSKI